MQVHDLEERAVRAEQDLSQTEMRLEEVLVAAEQARQREIYLEQNVQTLQRQLEHAQQRLELEVAVVSEIENMLEAAKAEKDAVKQEKLALMSEYDAKLANIEDAMQELKHQRDTALSQAAAAETMSTKLAQDMTVMQASITFRGTSHDEEVCELKQQLGDGKAKYELLHSEVNSQQAALTAVCEQLQSIEQDRNGLFEGLHAAEKRHAECVRELGEARDKVKQQASSIMEWKHAVERIASEREELSSLSNMQTEEIAALDRQIAALQGRLEEGSALAHNSSQTLVLAQAEKDKWRALAQANMAENQGVRARLAAAEADLVKLRDALRDAEAKMTEHMTMQSLSLVEWEQTVEKLSKERDEHAVLCRRQNETLMHLERQLEAVQCTLEEQDTQLQFANQALELALGERDRWRGAAEARLDELSSKTTSLAAADSEFVKLKDSLQLARNEASEQRASVARLQQAVEHLRADRDLQSGLCMKQGSELVVLEQRLAAIRAKMEEQSALMPGVELLQAEADRWRAVAESREGALLVATAEQDALQNRMEDMQKLIARQGEELDKANVRISADKAEMSKLKERVQEMQRELAAELEHKNEMLRASLRHEEACRRVLAELSEKQLPEYHDENTMSKYMTESASPTTRTMAGGGAMRDASSAENVAYRLTPMLQKYQNQQAQPAPVNPCSPGALRNALARAQAAEDSVAKLEKQVIGLTLARDELQQEATSLRRRTDELRQAAEDLRVVLVEADDERRAHKLRETAMAKDFIMLEECLHTMRRGLDVANEQCDAYIAQSRDLARALLDVVCVLQKSADGSRSEGLVRACQGIEQAVSSVASALLHHHTDWASHVSVALKSKADELNKRAQIWREMASGMDSESSLAGDMETSVVSAALHAQREALLSQQAIIAKISAENKV